MLTTEQGVLWGSFSEFLCCNDFIQKMTKFNGLLMQKEVVSITPPTEHSLSQIRCGIKRSW